MRIAYVCTDAGVPPFGHKGSSVHVQAVVGQLLERGHEVHLITPRAATAPVFLEGLHVHPLAGPEGPDTAAREVSARGVDRQTWAVLDDLHAEGRLDLVYERYALWGLTAMAWARSRHVVGVLEVNSPLPVEQAQHRHLVDRIRADAVARSATADANVVVCVSEPVAEWVRSLGRVEPGAVHVVPNGVDTRRFSPVVVPRRATTFTVGFVGTLKPWHGVDSLVEGVALLHEGDPSYRLLVVGDGPERHRLEELAARRGLSGAVEFTGATAPHDVPYHLARMDVGVAPYPPSQDFYFSPLKIYEYLAAGLAVVASDVGTIPDLLLADTTPIGVVYPAGSVTALASTLAGLRHDPGRRADLGRRGRFAVVTSHDWTQVVDRILHLSEVRHGATHTS